MRITFGNKRRWQNGDSANWLVFLWLPKYLPDGLGRKSFRWLEYVVVKYVYCNCPHLDTWPHWKAIRFVDDA